MLLIPYAVERPPSRVPVVTYSLLALNVLAYLLSVWIANQLLPQDKAILQRDLQRIVVSAMAESGRRVDAPISGEEAREWVERYLERHFDYALLWRLQYANADYVMEPHYSTVLSYGLTPRRPTLWGLLVTHMFLHAGIMHLLGNMLFLWLFGRALEDALGWWLFGISYLLGGFGAAVLHMVITHTVNPQSAAPMMGASGAISGLMGMFALRFYRTKIHVFYFVFFFFFFWRWGSFAIASSWGIAIWILQDVAGGLMDLTMPERHGGVAHWAHIGGFGLGMLYAALIGFKSEGTAEYALEDAEEAFSRGHFREAAELTAHYLTKNPHDAEAHLLRARSLVGWGNPQGALPHFAHAATAALNSGQVKRAGQIVEYVAESAPQFALEPGTHFSLALKLASIGEFSRAVLAFRSFAMAYPNEANAPWALVKAAELLREKLARPDEAQELLALARQRYPQSKWVQQT